MNILGIDTSSQNLALAVSENGTLQWESNKAQQFKHIELIVPYIDAGLKRSGLILNEIDVIACGIGPGSFTGLRVGLSVVKALCLVEKINVTPISSLDCVAHCFKDDGDLGVLIDARRDKIYYAQYSIKRGICYKKGTDRLISCRQLMGWLCQRNTKIVLTGDGIKSYGKDIKKACGKKVIFAQEDLWYPHGRFIIEAAQEKINKNDFVPVQRILPHYMRLTPAEERMKEGKIKRRKEGKI